MDFQIETWEIGTIRVLFSFDIKWKETQIIRRCWGIDYNCLQFAAYSQLVTEGFPLAMKSLFFMGNKVRIERGERNSAMKSLFSKIIPNPDHHESIINFFYFYPSSQTYNFTVIM